MRLLNTSSMRLEGFPDVTSAPPYAVLSHTWGEEEVGFQDIQSPKAHEMAGYTKILGSCCQAVLDHLTFVWIDTCCIDKTSSSELSEAINSMYLWYESAQVCYAYLADVPSNVESQGSSFSFTTFARSRWFTRGWTLQELLAPSTVVFYNQDWTRIGTKSSLRDEISDVTGIPASILVPNSSLDVSIAMRMSWASKRRTTRTEDMAYCLMGIFGVNMPLIYGEGRNAFTRLQQEILRDSDDQSIFAWAGDNDGEETGLLAHSPADFSHASKVSSFQHFPQEAPYSMTNHGLHIQVPIWQTSCRNLFYASLNCSLVGRTGHLQIYVQKKTEREFVRVWPSLVKVAERDQNSFNNPNLKDMYFREKRLPNSGGRSKQLGYHKDTTNTISQSFFLRTLPSPKHGFVLETVYPTHSSDNLGKDGSLYIGTAKILIFRQEKSGKSFTVTLGINDNQFLWCDFPHLLKGTDSDIAELYESYKLDDSNHHPTLLFDLAPRYYESTSAIKSGDIGMGPGQRKSVTIERKTSYSKTGDGYTQTRQCHIDIAVHTDNGKLALEPGSRSNTINQTLTDSEYPKPGKTSVFHWLKSQLEYK